MHVINEKDEENPENSRTIDTDSGIFLRRTESFPKELMVSFVVTDGEFQFWINTEKKLIGDKEVIYQVYGIFPKINLKYKKYISALLEEYQFYYGPFEDLKKKYSVEFFRVEDKFFKDGDEQ